MRHRPGHTGQSLGALRNQISLSTAQTNIVNNHIGRVLESPRLYCFMICIHVYNMNRW